MKFFPTICFLLYTMTSLAQDWSPFVPGQVSYYRVAGVDSLMVRREVLAQYDRGTHTTFYFHDGFSDSCTAEQLDDAYFEIWEGWFPDSLLVFSDRFEYHTAQNNMATHYPFTIVFPHQLQPGQSFRIPFRPSLWDMPPYLDSLDITYDSAATLTFQGITDSVKYFHVQRISNGQPASHPLNGTSIILSQHHGFVQFLSDISFPWLMPADEVTTLVMAGIANDTLTAPIHVPTNNEWIAWQPGDILIWEYYQDYPLSQQFLRFRDSIVSINRQDTLFTYYFNREIQDQSNGQVTYQANLERSYQLTELSQNLQSNTQQLFQPYPNYLYEYLGVVRTMTARNDTLHGYRLEDYGIINTYFIDSTCTLDQWVDYSMITSDYDVQRGLTYQSSRHMYGTNTLILLGYRTATDTVGNTWPLSVDNPKTPLPLSLYPNPASTFVQLSLPQEAAATGIVTLLDITGRIVLQQPLNGQLHININDLPTGWYAVQVVTGTDRWIGKLLIE